MLKSFLKRILSDAFPDVSGAHPGSEWDNRGGGHNTGSIAGNVGLTAHLLPHKKVTPTVLAMYGYNSVIVFREQGVFSPVMNYITSTGFSAGAGIDFK